MIAQAKWRVCNQSKVPHSALSASKLLHGTICYSLLHFHQNNVVKYVMSLFCVCFFYTSPLAACFKLHVEEKRLTFLFLLQGKIKELRVSLSREPSSTASPPTATRKLHLVWMSLMNRPPVALSILAFARWTVLDSSSETAFERTPNSIVFGVSWQPEGAPTWRCNPNDSRLFCVWTYGSYFSTVCHRCIVYSLNMILWTHFHKCIYWLLLRSN